MRKVLVDIYERESGIPELLSSKLNIPIELASLEVGDYLVSERVVVERKSLRDFINSLKSKRLHEQLFNLREKVETPVIIIEGRDIYRARGLHTKGLMGAIILITVGYGIPIIFSDSKLRTAEYIALLYKKEEESEGEHYIILPKRRTRSKEEEVMRVALSLPGVGLKLGRTLMKRFKTLNRLFNATEKELMEVENIGRERARRLLEIFHYSIEEEGLF